MLKSKVKVGRGILNPLFSAQRVEDMKTAKHLKNIGIVASASKVAKPDPDEALRADFIRQGLIKPNAEDAAIDKAAEERETQEEYYLRVERDYANN